MSDSESLSVSFYAKKDVLNAIDERAKSLGMNRSEFLNWFFTTAFKISPSLEKSILTIFEEIAKVKKPIKKEAVLEVESKISKI